ncbi:MAG TPA: hypothetical protein VEJ41_07800 [Candidatus Acidoferrales bacterium]|nr:hypothetical protein [Candidatus Acidoferrales bacterium]
MFLSDPPHDDAVRALADEALSEEGYVPNFVRLWSWRPDVRRAFDAARSLLATRTDLTDREVAILNSTTASQLGDAYCSIAWGSKLASLTSPATAASVLRRADSPELNGRERALMAWASAIVADPNATTRDDVQVLKGAGLSEREIFDATLLVAFRLAFGTVNGALGAAPDKKLVEQAPPDIRTSVTYGRAEDDARV